MSIDVHAHYLPSILIDRFDSQRSRFPGVELLRDDKGVRWRFPGTEPTRPVAPKLSDLNGREFAVLGLLAIAVLWMGLHPAPFTEIMHVSVGELLKHLAASKL